MSLPTDKELLIDLIPFIQRTFSVNVSPKTCVLAGLSNGGGQALNFG